MNPFNFPFALIGFLGFVLVVPLMSHFIGVYAPGLPAESRFLASLVPPAFVSLFLVSWLAPSQS